MAKLGEVCEILDNKRIPITASNRQAGPYPYYGANGVQDYVNDYIFDDELVLLAEDGGNFGSKEKPIAYRVSGKCWVNNHAHVLKPKQGLNVDYLCYSLMFYDVSTLVNGATRKKLTQADMRKIEIPLPPLEEQQKIAMVLDKVTDLIDKRKQQLAKLDELIKSRFVEMFGDLHNNNVFPYTPIKNFTKVVSGGTPDRKNPTYWKNGNIKWIKTTELKNKIITETEEKITELGLKNSSAQIVPKNTILIAMYGQGKTRGMTGYLLTEACTNQACACILPSSQINTKYLWQVIIMCYEKIRNLAKGGNQPNLNSELIKNFPILSPPLDLQNQFAEFVEQTEKTKVAINHSLDKLETLKKALMQKYFG